MTISPTEIQGALDRLIYNESGKAFQRLALQYLRSRYPELIATHTSHDAGQDAIISIARPDGTRISVACSITATLRKIKDDCKRIASSSIKPHRLVFCTAHQVRNIEIESWRELVRNQYGWELDVLEREELVVSSTKCLANIY